MNGGQAKSGELEFRKQHCSLLKGNVCFWGTLVWLSGWFAALAAAQPPFKPPQANSQPAVADSQPAAETDDDYKLGLGLYRAQRWALAAQAFEAFIRKNPQHVRVPEARFYLAICFENQGRYQKARELFRQLLQGRLPDQLVQRAKFRVAECSYFLDDLPAAEQELKTFLAEASEGALAVYAWSYLGDVQLRLGKAQSAAEAFQKALELAPQGRLVDDVQFGLARALEMQGKTEQACEVYRRLAEKAESKRAEDAQFRLAVLAFKQRRFLKAAELFARFEQRFPNSSQLGAALVNAGFAYYQLGRWEQAAEFFEKARRFPAQQTVASFWLAVCWKAQKQYRKAVRLLSTLDIAAASPEIAQGVLFQQAHCLMLLGQYEEAANLFEMVAQKWPKAELADDSLVFSAECWLLEGDWSRALQQLDRFERLFPESELKMYAQVLRGRALTAGSDSKNWEQAAELFRRVLKNGHNARNRLLARVQLARVLMKLKRPADALKQLEPLVRAFHKMRNKAETSTSSNSKEAASQTEHAAGSSTSEALSAKEGRWRQEAEQLKFYPEAWVVLAEVFFRNQKYAETVEAATQYLEQEPNGPNALQALVFRTQANARLNKKAEWQQDVKTLVERFGSSKETFDCLLALAELAYDREQWSEAQQLYETVGKLAEREPAFEEQEAAALSGTAWCLLKQGQYERAAELFQELAKRFPEAALVPEALYARGVALHLAGHSEEAVQELSAVGEKFPESPEAAEAALAVARILHEQQRDADADKAYEQAFKRLAKLPAPKRPYRLDELLREWAALNVQAQRYQRADQVFRLLLEKTPESPWADEARYSLAESDLLAGNVDKAARVFKQLAQTPKVASDIQRDALYRLVQIAALKEQWNAVVEQIEQLEKKFPHNPYHWELQFLLGQALLKQGKAAEAAKHLAPLVKRTNDPQVTQADWFPHAWILLAEAYLQVKKYKEVEQLAKRFTQQFPNSPFQYRMDDVLGRAYKRQAKFDLALKWFRKVVESVHGRRTETAAQAQLMIAETYFLQKKYKTAQLEYLKVYHLYDFPEWRSAALLQAGVCDELLGDRANAEKTYQHLLEKFPDSPVASKARSRLNRLQNKQPSSGR